ncbi:hypothetical protein GW17_00060971 [Ensete ventricosum]|nr:hypothetical protein GW17_00060971 [Ensete ventricosum]
MAVVAHGHDRLRPAHKGLPPMARPLGATAHDAPARGSRLCRGNDGGVEGGKERARWERGGDSGTHDAVAGDYDTS